jgi:hypothetical protein
VSSSAFGDDVHFEVRARHARLYSRGGRLFLRLGIACILGCSLLSDRLGRLRSRLLGDRLLDSRRLLDSGLFSSHWLLFGGPLGDRRRLHLGGLLGGLFESLGRRVGSWLGWLGLIRLVVLCRLVVGHQASISIGCGFWAIWGCSGPA